MVIDDQSTYINSIGRQNKDQSNLKSNKKLPQNVETFSNFLKIKLITIIKRWSQAFWPRP